MNFLLSLFVLPFLGCWNPFNPPSLPIQPPPPIEPQERLLQDLVKAYNQKDINSYMACLSDTFIFQFALVDSAELRAKGFDQPWWGRTDEEIATRNLFQNAERIELIIYAGAWNPSSSDTTIYETRRPYHLFFRGTIPETKAVGEIDADGYANFKVGREGTNGTWKIIRWIDEKLSG